MLRTITTHVYCMLIHTAVGFGTRPPKQYVVNLDLPEEQRWTRVVLEHKEFVQAFHEMVAKYIPEEFIPMAEKIAADVDQYIAALYAAEMKGIADVFGCFRRRGCYGFCTSIVSQDSKGQIWHARNLDYSFTDILKNITVAVDFQKGGKTVYSGITYAGYIGLMTGQKPYGFTITVDERDQGSILYNILVGLLDKSVVPVSFLVRDVLFSSSNFTAALDLLAYTPTAAPVYFIMGGVNPGEGVVITKCRLEPDDIWIIDPTNGRWFEAETNYDHWVPPPTSDDRRDPANEMMQQLGQNNLSVQSLYNVMSTNPVLNHKITYTVVMSAAEPELMQS